MGYASYLEDIIQRLNSDLGKIKAEVNATKVPSGRQKDYLKALARQCERVLQQILNIVTDPRLDTTFGMLKLEEENKKLRKELKIKETRIRELNRELSDMEGTLIDERRMNKRLRKDLEFMENPDKFYDAYSSPEMIKKNKLSR